MQPIVFFGSSNFSLCHLIALESARLPYEVILSVTGSRFTPVAKYCSNMDMPCIFWSNKSRAEEIVGSILKLIPSRTIAVVVSFGRFLPQSLRMAMSCVINLHPSLLPRWRGANPLMHTLLVGDCVSGVSVVAINKEHIPFDAGPLLLQRSIVLPSSIESATHLAHFLAPLSVEALIEVLSDLQSKLKLSTPQFGPSLAAPKPHMGMAVVNWRDQSAEEIARIWSALSDWFYLHTSLVLHLPSDGKYLKESVETEVKVSFNKRTIVLYPLAVEQEIHTNANLQHVLSTARECLSDRDWQKTVLPGDIIYIERESEGQLSRPHPSRDLLLPLVCVAARDGSWVGLCDGLVVGHTMKRRRPLAALDFYSGYFTSKPNCWRVRRLIDRVWHVGRFESAIPNPLYPLPSPLLNQHKLLI